MSHGAAVGRLSKAAVLVGWLTAASGCYSYVPTEFAAVPEGQDIQVRLTRQGLADVPEIADDVGYAVKGRLVRVEGDVVVVRVPLARPPGPPMSGGSVGRDIAIPLRGVDQVERREFSRTRTALAVLGGVAAILGVVTGVGDDDGDSQPLPRPPSEESSRIPISPH